VDRFDHESVHPIRAKLIQSVGKGIGVPIACVSTEECPGGWHAELLSKLFELDLILD
jgi:hypothetical protein